MDGNLYFYPKTETLLNAVKAAHKQFHTKFGYYPVAVIVRSDEYAKEKLPVKVILRHKHLPPRHFIFTYMHRFPRIMSCKRIPYKQV